MTSLTVEQIDTIATAAAGRYVNKGVRSYSFEDMYQDAACQALYAAARWDASKSTPLEKYCYIAAERELHHKITKAIAPVSSRGRHNTPALGKTCKAVSLEFSDDETGKTSQSREVLNKSHHDGQADLETCQIKAVVRIQCQRVLADDPNALRVLPALSGLCDPSDLVEDDFTIKQVRASMQRARRKLRNDLTLWKAANNA